MKKPSVSRLQNILFTVAVAAAVLVIYLVFGGRGTEDIAVQSVPETPYAEPAERTRFVPVLESIFIGLIENDAKFAAMRAGDGRTYTLESRADVVQTAVLTYAVRDGAVASFTLRFPVREKSDAGSGGAIETALAARYGAYLGEQNSFMQSLLAGCVSACDLDDVMEEAVLLRWYTALPEARDDEKHFSDEAHGCTFMAYPSYEGQTRTVVCSFLI